ncbi:MAG: alpha/beta hydrolase [Fluviicola sp. XM-24bin1]|nr:MAG: alpha/beta hydrolase [Fluviicola sp. XM-24bin1]
MHLIEEKNVVYTGADNRESFYDITIPENWNRKLIVFVHGYMGFKDWGCWHLTGQFFVDNSYGFVKYNVSHNGGTTSNPIDFPDTEAFSKNSYSKELEDFERVIETLNSRIQSAEALEADDFEIYTIGHSRGGGIVALQSGHPKVAKWASWAGISSIEKRFPSGEALEKWKNETYRYVKNGRTKQDLPHHFDQYLDFEMNRDRLNIQLHCEQNEKPCLILHGRDDTSVLLLEGENLSNWTGTPLVIIDNAQHTFNASHPWDEAKMPAELEETCRQTLLFFES